MNFAVRVIEGKRGLKSICIGLVSGLEAGEDQFQPRCQVLGLSIGISLSWCASRIWMMGGGVKIYHRKRLGRSVTRCELTVQIPRNLLHIVPNIPACRIRWILRAPGS